MEGLIILLKICIFGLIGLFIGTLLSVTSETLGESNKSSKK